MKKTHVDLIVTNAKVYTVDEDFSVARSFAVKDGKFIAVGSEDEISQNYEGAGTYDARGKFIYPGFYDAHCHFYGYGMNLIKFADLAGTKSTEEIYDILQKHHKEFGGEWILGRGWDQNDWALKEFPDKEKLDELFPDVAVYLIRIDGHAGWCNSKALALAGIDATTKVNGGEVLLKNGQPSGVLIDNAETLVGKVMPAPTAEQQVNALLAAQKNCFAVGLTSVTDCGLDKSTILLMDELQKSDQLKMRINAMLSPTEENVEHFVKKGIYKTDRLHVNTIKLYIDGALGSRGAWLLEDYSDDSGNKGLMMHKAAYYDTICSLAYQSNYQVATHCIGDAGNRFMLETYAKFLKEKNDRRWRIEHAQIIHPQDFAFFGKFSIVPSIQATHATSDMYWAGNRLDDERLKGAYAYKQLLDQNGWLPNGTDFPIESIRPILTFYASVARKDLKGWPKDGFQMENALTREEALRSITVWAAKASFEEQEKGSIEAGKWADFVVLNNDLMTATEKELPGIKVLKTFSSGELVYE